MKKTIIVFICLFLFFCLNEEENNYGSYWKIKTYREKYAYLEGFFECGSTLCNNIDKRLSKIETEKKISSESADFVEIPIAYILYAYGNSQTNGIDSIIEYIDQCYKNDQFTKFSVYDLITGAARMGLKENEKFKWIFEQE